VQLLHWHKRKVQLLPISGECATQAIMSPRHIKHPEPGETSFRRWRREAGFTQQQAADALGVSLSTVKNWDAGEERGKPGMPAIPSRATRYLMAAILRGNNIEPWPEQ
jgi:DNA-binding transcriptional regulator YiaG